MPYEITESKIEYKTEDKNSLVVIDRTNELMIGKNEYQIKVTSEKGNTKIYRIHIIRQNKILSKNNRVKAIKIKNYNLEFNGQNQYNYKLKIKKETELDIKITLEDSTATYKIIGNQNLENGSIIYINVISESGELSTYSITIEKEEIINYIPIILIIYSLDIIMFALVFKNKTSR